MQDKIFSKLVEVKGEGMKTDQMIDEALARIAQIESEGQKELSINKAILKERMRKVEKQLNELSADCAAAGFNVNIHDNQIEGSRILGGHRFCLSATKPLAIEEL